MQPDTKKQHSHYHAVITFKNEMLKKGNMMRIFFIDFIHSYTTNNEARKKTSKIFLSYNSM